MSFSTDGTYDRYAKTIRRARKQHTCCACSGSILPKHYYVRIYAVFDGSSDTIIRCGSCERTHSHLVDLCYEADDDMWPSERLDCGESYQSHWRCDPPESIAKLPFLSPGDVGNLLAPVTVEGEVVT